MLSMKALITVRKRRLGPGNVFTPYCSYPSIQWTWGQIPLGRQLPPPPQTATEADATPPTGMHSC